MNCVTFFKSYVTSSPTQVCIFKQIILNQEQRKSEKMKRSAETSIQTNRVVVAFLNLLLADEYVLYTKTRTAHWNVDDTNYFELHVSLENQYNTLDFMIDEIAEQIRSLGHYALGSLKDFLSIAQMSDDHQNFRKTTKILETLRTDHELIMGILEHEILSVSEHLNATDTALFLSRLLEQHKKMVRTLNSLSINPGYQINQETHTNSSRLVDWQD